jgi:transposase
MPPKHRYWADWTPERIVEWAKKTGPATAELTRQIIASRAHPQQGYRSCLGILRLGEAHGRERLEAAAERALALRSYSYRSIASILKHGLEGKPLLGEETPPRPITHENLRGAAYYAQTTEETHHQIDPNRRYEC